MARLYLGDIKDHVSEMMVNCGVVIVVGGDMRRMNR